MTLRIAVDNDSNVEKLEVYNFQDIAACARRFAEQLESGVQGEPFRAVLIAQSEVGMAISVWGESADAHQMMGICEAAKLQVFADHITDD